MADETAKTPRWMWPVALVLTAVVWQGGNLALRFAPQPAPAPVPAPDAPGVDAVLLAKAKQALAGDTTGEGAAFLIGYFKAFDSYMEFDSFKDRATLHRFLANSAEGWKYGADYQLQPGALFADPYAWMATGGPLSADDKLKIRAANRGVIAALEAAD